MTREFMVELGDGLELVGNRTLELHVAVQRYCAEIASVINGSPAYAEAVSDYANAHKSNPDEPVPASPVLLELYYRRCEIAIKHIAAIAAAGGVVDWRGFDAPYSADMLACLTPAQIHAATEAISAELSGGPVAQARAELATETDPTQA